MMNIFKQTGIFLKLMKEGVSFSFSSIWGDKFRAFLSLMGVSIGIFAIIAVFQVVDSMQAEVMQNMETLGTDVVYIDKSDWASTDFQWWKYRQRPSNKYEEYEYLRAHCTAADVLGFSVQVQATVKNQRNSVPGVRLSGITFDWNRISPFTVERGRYFTEAEARSSQGLALIGAKLAEDLFPGQDPVNQTMKAGNYTVRVIGVLEKQGNAVSFIPYDEAVLLPLQFMHNYVDFRKVSPAMVAHKHPQATTEEFKAQLRMHLRNVRRLKPVQEDNFALNETEFIQDQVNDLFKTVNRVGGIIGGFAILIGAFGIANIMFVSVKERTHLIGIQKALGAKSYFILTQFIAESLTLSVLGGIMGLLLVALVAWILTTTETMPMTISLANVVRGLLISAGVGALAGLIPAWQAARLDPVEAINKH